MKVDGYSVQRSRFQRLDPEFIALRTRSAALQADPKAKELDHFLCSHSHEDRVRSAVGAATRMQSGNLSVSARNGTDLVDQAQEVRRIEADLYHLTKEDQMRGFGSRFEWRREMDRQVKRIMQDMELATNDSLLEQDKHRMRCDQLDKAYAWFQRHARKEASKEKEAPPYLRQNQGAPPMPGSSKWEAPSSASRYQQPKSPAIANTSMEATALPSTPHAASATFTTEDFPQTRSAEHASGQRLAAFWKALSPPAEKTRLQVLEKAGEGKVDACLQIAAEELARARKDGDEHSEAIMQLTIAEVNMSQGSIEDAIKNAKEAMPVFARKGDPIYEARALMAIVASYALNGKLREAAAQAQHAQRLYHKASDPAGETESRHMVETLTNLDNELAKQDAASRAMGAEGCHQLIKDRIWGNSPIVEQVLHVAQTEAARRGVHIPPSSRQGPPPSRGQLGRTGSLRNCPSRCCSRSNRRGAQKESMQLTGRLISQ